MRSAQATGKGEGIHIAGLSAALEIFAGLKAYFDCIGAGERVTLLEDFVQALNDRTQGLDEPMLRATTGLAPRNKITTNQLQSQMRVAACVDFLMSDKKVGYRFVDACSDFATICKHVGIKSRAGQEVSGHDLSSRLRRRKRKGAKPMPDSELQKLSRLRVATEAHLQGQFFVAQYSYERAYRELTELGTENRIKTVEDFLMRELQRRGRCEPY